ncbi:hypothetical protein Pelo_8337 [Pelomyxa schiedti]|nr:hypothetical protein Pelo_8337 [Pelomyxa schiedti]
MCKCKQRLPILLIPRPHKVELASASSGSSNRKARRRLLSAFTVHFSTYITETEVLLLIRLSKIMKSEAPNLASCILVLEVYRRISLLLSAIYSHRDAKESEEAKLYKEMVEAYGANSRNKWYLLTNSLKFSLQAHPDGYKLFSLVVGDAAPSSTTQQQHLLLLSGLTLKATTAVASPGSSMERADARTSVCGCHKALQGGNRRVHISKTPKPHKLPEVEEIMCVLTLLESLRTEALRIHPRYGDCR